MIRNSLLTTAVLVTTAIGSAAFADGNHGRTGQPGSGNEPGMMMQYGGPGMNGCMMGMMQRMHGDMMGSSMMGANGPMGGGMMQIFDADRDGTVTPEELRTQLQAKLTEYDSDGDGTLSIAEFETLHSAMIREMMVDRFQYLDADGDGAVTGQEMTAPADRMELMQKMRSGWEQGQDQRGKDSQMGGGNHMSAPPCGPTIELNVNVLKAGAGSRPGMDSRNGEPSLERHLNAVAFKLTVRAMPAPA